MNLSVCDVLNHALFDLENSLADFPTLRTKKEIFIGPAPRRDEFLPVRGIAQVAAYQTSEPRSRVAQASCVRTGWHRRC